MRKINGLTGWKVAWIFILPSFIGFFLFRFVPAITSLLISFTNWNGVNELTIFSDFKSFQQEYFVGFSNYISIFTSAEFWNVMGNTFYFIILYMPAVIVLALLASLILNRKMKGVGFYRVLYYIPVITSWVAGALIWKWVLSPEYGIMNQILAVFGIDGPLWLQSTVWAMPAIVLASLWKDFGYFGLMFLGGLQGIDESYYEAAELDGANGWKKFRKITLPMLSPVTFMVVVIAVINSFQVFTQVMIMSASPDGTVGGPAAATQVMVERIYTYGFRYQEMGYASAYSWILCLIILVFTLIQLNAQKKWVNYDV